ncbi:thioredoxin [Dissoconium aciculare CBS 342.82]|jgi:thioredoxin|uniref:Thioredoxin n=1 Tax=Dissoconium aciculare CBS 342.82 TaxID=1314786 RepID=A0A6J3M954_9PEZI|nr:thioredoxin [Dissoconium aciculare CBS 342.82]KAF1824581.1 thioredoxin [Dissoconium aciculare CBS 342.82]
MSKTVHITSPGQFSTLLNSSRVVVVDFFADWCGPCKAIAPVYEQLSAQLSRPGQITFTKVDTEAQKAIASTYNISSLPTFVIFKAGRETKRITGADPKGLDAAVKQLAREAGEADASGAGASSSSGSGERWLGAAAPRAYGDITEQVEIQGLDFLNVDSQAGAKRVLFANEKPSSLKDSKGKSKAASEGEAKDWIESDTDEQLMLFMPFQASIKLHTIHLTSVPVDDDEITRPKTVRLYSNRSHVLGFDEAEDTAATQVIEIQESDWDATTHTAKLELRYVKFQNISSLVMFVEDGDGDGEKTRLDRIRLFGETGEKRAMGKLEKIGDEQGE